MSYPRKIFLFCFLLFLIPFASGQQLEEQVQVELVQVDVVATDSKGSMITDLTAEDFVLKESGDFRPITHFYNSANDDTRYPLTISLLIDTSYSMHETVAGLTRIDIALKAADLVMDQLIENDQIEVIEFNERANPIIPFTSNLGTVREKLKALTFQQKNTAMHDSVKFAVERIKGRSGRKIVVIFSDGMDSASKAFEEDVVEAIRRSDATILTFYSEFARLNLPSQMGGGPGPMGRVRIRAGEDALRLYSDMTGGQFFSFKKEAELLKALENFRAFLNSQYTLAYKPVAGGKKKAGFRKIKVECKRKGVRLKHREGYWLG
jgi:VWFA-related protein